MPQGDLLSSVTGLINSQGGVGALLQKLQAGGLSDQVASWIGSGENQAVSGVQIADAQGSNTVQDIARQAGMQPELRTTGLAHLLPQMTNRRPTAKCHRGNCRSRV